MDFLTKFRTTAPSNSASTPPLKSSSQPTNPPLSRREIRNEQVEPLARNSTVPVPIIKSPKGLMESELSSINPKSSGNSLTAGNESDCEESGENYSPRDSGNTTPTSPTQQRGPQELVETTPSSSPDNGYPVEQKDLSSSAEFEAPVSATKQKLGAAAEKLKKGKEKVPTVVRRLKFEKEPVAQEIFTSALPTIQPDHFCSTVMTLKYADRIEDPLVQQTIENVRNVEESGAKDLQKIMVAYAKREKGHLDDLYSHLSEEERISIVNAVVAYKFSQANLETFNNLSEDARDVVLVTFADELSKNDYALFAESISGNYSPREKFEMQKPIIAALLKIQQQKIITQRREVWNSLSKNDTPKKECILF